MFYRCGAGGELHEAKWKIGIGVVWFLPNPAALVPLSIALSPSLSLDIIYCSRILFLCIYGM